ncbi:MAG TPA: molybdopterin cofactor-binding domain-containing protein [Terriglobales bacterium]|nr:molybdopterin cofactor-binding domain-containing protein [Terriglobales bacterium]
MKKELTAAADLERSQHESIERARYAFELDRRQFFKLLGGGVLVCSCATVVGQESGRRPRPEHELPKEVSAWLHMGENGAVTVYTGKAEMGQNIRTSLAQQVAEELRVPLSSITMVMGDTELTPWDMGTFGSRTTPTMGPRLREVASTAREVLVAMAAERWNVQSSTLVARDGTITNPRTKQSVSYGELTPWDMGTFGSRTTPTMGPRLREVAATARQVLVAMAAERWQVQAATLVAAEGKVNNPRTGQSLSYGELTRGQQITKLLPDDPALTPPGEWRVAGTAAPKVDGRAFVTGQHRYAADMILPGMMYGKIVRPSAFNATLVSLDISGAEKLPSVRVVHDGNFVGVVGPDQHTAEQALHAIKAQWKAPAQPSNQELFDYLRKNVDRSDEGLRHVLGSVGQKLPPPAKTLSATYTLQYIAHAPLEPRAAVAEWNGDKLTVWTGSQRPFAVADQLAEELRIPRKQVRVIIPDTGSAYGGKHSGECAVEAARLAKAAGKPVRLVWTREEEFTWAYFRPAGVIDIKAGVGADGKVLTWEHDNYNSGPAAINTPYDVPNQRIEFHPVNSPLRQGSYRGLAAPANFFARESAMDELAHLAGMDPMAFRLKNTSDARLRAVLQAAADHFGWGKQKSTPQLGFGIACGFEKGSYVATCAEVEVAGKGGPVRISRVVEAFDCGPVVNPNGLRNQIEGAITQAIGGAMFEAIRFQDGKILNPHFSQYRVPRLRDLPPIEVVLVDRKDVPPAGAGETPNMGLAPALANAIFAATGVRLRSLPLLPQGSVGNQG